MRTWTLDWSPTHALPSTVARTRTWSGSIDRSLILPTVIPAIRTVIPGGIDDASSVENVTILFPGGLTYTIAATSPRTVTIASVLAPHSRGSRSTLIGCTEPPSDH